MRIEVEVSDEVHRRLQEVAATEETTVQELAEQAINELAFLHCQEAQEWID